MFCVCCVYNFDTLPYWTNFCDSLLSQLNLLRIWITKKMITLQGQTIAMIIYLSDEFSYTVKDTSHGSQLWDGLFIDVYGESLCGNLTIGNIYRPSRHNNNNNTVRQFCSELQPVVSNISKHNTNAIITGDFNIDLLQINERSEFQKYFDLFTTYVLFPSITLPTRSSGTLIDHSILLTKLNFYGFSGSASMWFRSYLSNRQKFVDFDGTVSDVCTLSTGVPQGSILAPLLFIIYMNDIYIASKQFNVILYADDTNMISPMCSFSSQIPLQSISMVQLSLNINVELNKIHEWLSINKLSLNFKKTKFMIFHYRQRNIDLILDLQINSETIERITEFDFLGLTLDENLNWNAHIQKVSNEISRTLGVMCRLKNFLPLHVSRILYNSLILPHLQYGILTWGFCLGRLQKLQKRLVGIITRSKYNAHTDPLFKSLNLLKLKDLFELSVFKIYFKFKHNLLPVYILNMLIESIKNHSYNLWTRGPLEFVNSSTTSGEKCLRCYLPNFIKNSSPQVLDKINTHSYEGFSFFIKRSQLNSYHIECTVPNCYICSNCHWIYPVLILGFYFVLCYVFHGYPVQELFLWFVYLYPILFSHVTDIFLCFF